MCDKNTLKCDTQKGQILNKCCENNLVELLEVIDRIFNKHNILYWIDYGTLLGSTRDGKIIPYDDDCDIGILRQDLDKVLCLSDEFRLLGYHLVSWFYPNFLRLDFSRINELHVDIFVWDIKNMPFRELWQDIDKEIITTCLYRQNYIPGKDETKGRNFPIEYLFPLTESEINGLIVHSPNNPERFCQFRYGKDWQVNKRENNG